MRIWIVDPTGKTPYYDLGLVLALRERALDVELMTSRFVHEPYISQADELSNYFFFQALEPWTTLLKRFPYFRWGSRLLVYAWDLLRFRHELERVQPDVLHIQWTYFPRLDQHLFKRLARQVPLILTVHNPLIRSYRLAKLDDMVSFCAMADRVIVHANENRDALVARTGINPDKVRVIPHGPLFENAEVPDPAYARTQLGLPTDAPIILFFGIIAPYKGLSDLIKAFAQVVATLPTARLLVAGRPEDSIQPYRDEAVAFGLGEQVIFDDRYIPSDEVPLYFSAPNVVCLPYREASQSGVLLSAYRFGKAVVTTNVGALSQTVEEGKNGYVVPPCDPQALSEALLKILSNPQQEKTFAAYSEHLAQTRFSWSRAAELTHAVYDEVVP